MYTTGEYRSEVSIESGPDVLTYNNYESAEDKPLIVESKFIGTDNATAGELVTWLQGYHQTQHLLIKMSLGIRYSTLEVGSIIRFDALLGGVKAYGIDYTNTTDVVYNIDIYENIYFYPMFFITSVTRRIDGVEIECMQLFKST